MLGNIEQQITAFLQQNNNPLGLTLLGLCAMVEYLFPPFPGDMVVLFGALLIARYGWSLPLVFVSVLAGSGVGSMIDFAVGVWMKQRYEQGRFLRGARSRRAVERVLQAFWRHGELYVALNRFLPAVRAVFFLAAGMAGLRAWRVLLFSLVSASAWNALIIGAGYAVGANWQRIKELFSIYSTVAWSVLGLTALGLLLRWWVRRRRSAGPRDGGTAQPGRGDHDA
jgi:membrane protein DedA with SNARE-associated domain